MAIRQEKVITKTLNSITKSTTKQEEKEKSIITIILRCTNILIKNIEMAILIFSTVS